ncbi:Kynurenine formamidase [bacterium HR26]|nr:Kynurenine formamidase [bacterium HR26]
MRPRIVDLTHPLGPAIPMFPGLPGPEIEAFLGREATAERYAPGVSFVVHRYRLIGNSGTYLDAPYHRYEDGLDLASLPLDHTADLPGVMVDVADQVEAGRLAIGPERFVDLDLAGCAVLVRTGWDARWGTPDYLATNPYLTGEAADALVAAGAVLVGIDSWNVDDVADLTRPVHSRLLARGIPIVENLRGLDRLPRRGFRFHAAPLPIPGGSSVPVRAYAIVVER